jgi:hypothetical protein
MDTSLRLKRDRLKLTVAALAAALVFAVAWSPMLLRQRAVGREAAIWVANRDAQPVTATLLDALLAPARLFLEPPDSARPVAAALLIALAIFVIMAARRRGREFRLWLLLLAGTIGFTLVLDLVNNTSMLKLIRYSLLAGPAVYMIVALLGARRGRLTALALPAGLTIAGLLALPGAYNRSNVDFRPMAAYLDRMAGGRDGVVVFHRLPGWTWHAGFLWVTWSHYTRHGPDESPRVLFLDEPPPATLVEELRRVGRFVLVGRSEDRSWIDSVPGALVVSRRSFPGGVDVAEMSFDGGGDP